MPRCKDCAYFDDARNICRATPPAGAIVGAAPPRIAGGAPTFQTVGVWPPVDPEKDFCGLHMANRQTIDVLIESAAAAIAKA